MMYLLLCWLTTQAPAPCRVLDLSHWKLTLPVGTDGLAETIRTDALLAGYHSEYFFATGDGGVTFWSPATGATTPHAAHPRCELREMPGHWTMRSPALLQATLRVEQVPEDSRTVVVGQIHGDEGAPPLLLLFYTDRDGLGTLKAGVHDASDRPLRDYPLLDHIRLGSLFSYAIRVTRSGELLLSAGKGTPVRIPIDPSWEGKGLYFKAGAYVQSDAHGVAVPGDGGKATFYALHLTH